MNFDFWKILYNFFNQTHEKDEIIEYEYDGLDKYKCVITAHRQDEDTIVINLFDIEKWEMVLDLCEVSGSDISDIVKDLGEDEVLQIRLSARDFNL